MRSIGHANRTLPGYHQHNKAANTVKGSITVTLSLSNDRPTRQRVIATWKPTPFARSLLFIPRTSYPLHHHTFTWSPSRIGCSHTLVKLAWTAIPGPEVPRVGLWESPFVQYRDHQRFFRHRPLPYSLVCPAVVSHLCDGPWRMQCGMSSGERTLRTTPAEAVNLCGQLVNMISDSNMMADE